MDTYSTLRHFADSWALLALVLVFAGVIAFAWRPGSAQVQAEAGQVPFRHDDRPAPAGRADPGRTAAPAAAPRLSGGCCGGCAGHGEAAP